MNQMGRNQQYRIKSLLELGAPVVVGQLGIVLMGLIDNLMVGRIGHVSLAASFVANQVFFLVAVFGMGLLTAVTAVSSIALGERRNADIRWIARDSSKVALVISIVTMLIILAVNENFHILQQKPETIAEARSYLTIIGFSVLPMFFYYNFKSVADSHNLTMATMVVTLGSLAINAFLNWLLIFGNWGFPRLELEGAGYATLISRVLMAIAMIWFVHRSGRIQFHIADLFSRRPAGSPRFTREILRIGTPSGLQFMYEVSAFAIAGIMAGTIGAREMAAHSIAIGLAAFTYMFASGMATAGTIKVGEALGRKHRADLQAYGILSVKLTSIVMAIFAVIFYFFRYFLAGLFTTDTAVIHMASNLLLFAAVFQLFDGIQAVSLGNLRGLKDTKVPSNVAFIAYWLLALPLGYFLGIHLEIGMNGIWTGLTAGLGFTAVVLSLRFKKLSKIALQ